MARSRRTVLLAAVLFAAFGGGADAAAPRRVCEVVGFSPAFDQDRTAFCVIGEPDALIVSRSDDGGATWERLPGAGLQGLGAAFVSQVIVSPEYPANDTVYVHVVYGTSPGLYRSTDGGSTFVNLAPLVGPGYWSRVLTPFLLSDAAVPAPVGSGRDAFAYASPYARQPALLAPPLHRPVVGSPDPAELFLLPGDFPATEGFVVARGTIPSPDDPARSEHRYSVYRCDAALACATKAFDFPAGWRLGNGGVLDDGSVYVVMTEASEPRSFKVWRSAGGSFEEWRSLNAHLPDLSDEQAVFPSVSVVSAGPRHFARVSYDLDDFEAGPPPEQLFASRDGGASWRRVAFGRGPHHPGQRGAIPWHARTGPVHGKGDLYMPAPNVLVVLAKTDSFTGLYCSRTGGRTWTEGCAP